MLPEPTVSLVQSECVEFDKENNLGEEALADLLASFRANSKPSHVLLKVIALDQRYSTRIRYIDIERFACHIAGLGIDEHIDCGSPGAVDLIWNCPEMRHYYSFATKFCSLHNPTAYPIHDHYVDECLWVYKNQGHFLDFRRENMFDYSKFVPIVSAFRQHYNLSAFSFKQLDKFLWRMGARILQERPEIENAHLHS